MKPKFDIPLEASRTEIITLIRMYGQRLSHTPEVPNHVEWYRWNAERVSELIALLDKK